MWHILERMREHNIHPNALTFSLILERPILDKNLELAIQHMSEMNARGIIIELQTAEAIITLAAELGHPRLALDVASSFEEVSVRRLDSEVWLKCLISSAENLYVRLINNGNIWQFTHYFFRRMACN